jgi:glycosyltransferase involved in cell wall biosynthesis
MSVFDAGPFLAQAVESVLSQTGVDLELVAVDDGSTDESPRLLERYARDDARLRLIRQDNQGLTRALIRGCSEARGDYIARQDADDVSLPDRLRKQADLLAASPELALVSCWTLTIGPEGEELFTIRRHESPAEARRLLREADASTVKGIPGHGSAMYRRADYERAGGYRPEFYFAQDLDLWLRLTDVGAIGFVPEILYQVRFAPGCLSTRFHAEQMALARLALESKSLRERGQADAGVLAQATSFRPKANRGRSGSDTARGLYFIGRCLLDRRDRRAGMYLRAAARQRPWDLRSWTMLWLSAFLRT